MSHFDSKKIGDMNIQNKGLVRIFQISKFMFFGPRHLSPLVLGTFDFWSTGVFLGPRNPGPRQPRKFFFPNPKGPPFTDYFQNAEDQILP